VSSSTNLNLPAPVRLTANQLSQHSSFNNHLVVLQSDGSRIVHPHELEVKLDADSSDQLGSASSSTLSPPISVSSSAPHLNNTNINTPFVFHPKIPSMAFPPPPPY
jgi:hypothetical protein